MKIVCEQRCDEEGVRFFKDGVCGTIRTIDGGDKRVMETGEKIEAGIRVRKLTQLEAWRLMGFSDQDFYKAQAAMNKNLYGGNDRSGSQLYKQAGNSIVVDVLCSIMQELYQAMPYLFDDMVVGSFFSGIGAFEKALSTFDYSTTGNKEVDPIDSDELRQLGYINDYNGDANRIYDGATVARALKAEAGGGGAKTGWYKVKGVIDPQGRLNKRCTLRQDCPTLRAQHHGNPPEIVYGES